MTGFWISRAIYVAAKLGISDLLKDGPKEIDGLAKATGSHGPSLYRVRALASIGIFDENEPVGRESPAHPAFSTIPSP